MGDKVDQVHRDQEKRRRFTQHLLGDLRALERMIQDGWIESDVTRLGAEQEVFLVDACWRPAPRAMEILEELEDERYTTELGRFNMEFNLHPLSMEGNCLRKLERQLQSLIAKAVEVAARHDAQILLTGILPTLLKSDLVLDNMTPRPRYAALNEAVSRLRGEAFQLRIKGRDELIIRHGNVMLEAANTSFQVHIQVPADGFAEQYNIAQLIAAPVLAGAVNSPLLFDRQLWSETRIALFQQSIDTRTADIMDLRRQEPRVSFGQMWLKESAVEIFQEDIARFPSVLATDRMENALEELRAGRVPSLDALRFHNGTVYRWNRPCYGVSNGRPHLRIENRLLSSGPSVIDEIANAAFWLGLMQGARDEYGDIAEKMPFEAVRDNFIAAARQGLDAQLQWLQRSRIPAPRLILEELLPLAKQGLLASNVDSSDIDHYLGVIEARVESQRTGSRWLCESRDLLKGQGSSAERLAALVASMHEQQVQGKPVHLWEAPQFNGAYSSPQHYQEVGQLMSTDLFTVDEGQLIELAAQVMNWRHIRHIPVEDGRNRLVGLITHRTLLRLMANNLGEELGRPIVVRDIMETDVITTTPETPTLEALAMMREHRVSCLPVVNQQGHLVGIITERDFMSISAKLLEDFLSTGQGQNGPS